MRILLVRHGETDYNKNELVQGHTDIPLNDTGINQAKSAAEKINNEKIDAAYSSTMSRAHDTCRYMLANSNNGHLSIEQDERIIEKHYGKFENATYEEWHRGQVDNDLDTVETTENIVNRMTNFFEDKYKNHKDETIIVVCHGACIRIFLDSMNLRPNKNFIKNTGLTILERTGSEYNLLEYNL